MCPLQGYEEENEQIQRIFGNEGVAEDETFSI